MKKVLSYILILVIVFANLFAPFSVGINEKNTPKIIQNIASASGETVTISIDPKPDGKLGIKINGIFTSSEKVDSIQIAYTIGKNSDSYMDNIVWDEKDTDEPTVTLSTTGEKIYNYSFGQQLYQYAEKTDVFKDVVKGDTYFARAIILKKPLDGGALQKFLSPSTQFTAGSPSQTGTAVTEEGKAAAKAAYDAVIAAGGTEEQAFIAAQGAGNEKPTENKDIDTMPACDLIWGKGTFMGCVAQGFYYVLFVPTSYLFALSGVFFDNTFAYSVQDSSYKSSFVIQGWGLVRDFCNLFFIFILLYIAIGTTLSLHGINTKGVIINVVIIGLFINFSLFATQVIIDASNVAARVFYNADTIKITVKGQTDNTLANATDGGSIVAEEKEGGVINLSEALVNKINPQNIIINSKMVNKIPIKGGGAVIVDDDREDNMDAGTFILITVLAVAVNVIGTIVFLSVGLIFVSRVIGLWVAMILSPLAFFTYVLPSMSGTKMIGWKNWWPETLKLAFLAPVFMFFMYIILKFLQLDLISDPMSKDGLTFFIATLIPFAFIMILMLKAKGIAKDMSGELGQQITGGVSAAGGMLLGGAALGTAFLGRKLIGGGLAYASRTEGAKKIGAEKIKFNEKLSAWKQANPNATTGAPTWKEHKAQNGIKETPISWIGAKLNQKQTEVNKLDHATHEIEEAKKAAGLVDSKGNVLADHMITGADEEKLKTNFNKSKRSDVETNAKKGLSADGKEQILLDGVAGGEEAFKSKKRADEINKVKNDPEFYNAATNELTKAGEKKVENELNIKLNAAVKSATDEQLTHLFEHVRAESKQGVSMLTRGFARSNKGSYDVRELSGIKAGKKDSLMSKIPTAMIAGVALGVRAGLKNSGVDHGKSQGDFMKDMGATITEALKGIKVEVPKASSGGGHGGGGGHDDHGGGGHGGGGGHH